MKDKEKKREEVKEEKERNVDYEGTQLGRYVHNMKKGVECTT